MMNQGVPKRSSALLTDEEQEDIARNAPEGWVSRGAGYLLSAGIGVISLTQLSWLAGFLVLAVGLVITGELKRFVRYRFHRRFTAPLTLVREKLAGQMADNAALAHQIERLRLDKPDIQVDVVREDCQWGLVVYNRGASAVFHATVRYFRPDGSLVLETTPRRFRWERAKAFKTRIDNGDSDYFIFARIMWTDAGGEDSWHLQRGENRSYVNFAVWTSASDGDGLATSAWDEIYQFEDLVDDEFVSHFSGTSLDVHIHSDPLLPGPVVFRCHVGLDGVSVKQML